MTNDSLIDVIKDFMGCIQICSSSVGLNLISKVNIEHDLKPKYLAVLAAMGDASTRKDEAQEDDRAPVCDRPSKVIIHGNPSPTKTDLDRLVEARVWEKTSEIPVVGFYTGDKINPDGSMTSGEYRALPRYDLPQSHPLNKMALSIHDGLCEFCNAMGFVFVPNIAADSERKPCPICYPPKPVSVSLENSAKAIAYEDGRVWDDPFLDAVSPATGTTARERYTSKAKAALDAAGVAYV